MNAREPLLALETGTLAASGPRLGARVRTDAVSDSVVRGAALALGAWVLAYGAVTGAIDGREPYRSVLDHAVYQAPVAAAAVLTLLAALRSSGRHRVLWGILTASNLSWLAAGLMVAYHEVVLGTVAPPPSSADALYLFAYACVPPAIVLGFRTNPLRLGRALVDTSIVVVAVGVGGFQLLISPQLSPGFSLTTATMAAYPLSGVAILMVLSTVAFGANRQVPLSVAVIGLAFAVAVLTNVADAYLKLAQPTVSLRWLDVGWQAEAALLCLGALVAVRHREGEAEAQFLARDSGLPVVLVGVAATVAIVTLDHVDEGFSLSSTLLAAYAIVAVIVRLALTSRDTEQVARRLHASLGEQERLAVTDGLTGLRNRRFAEEVLRIEVERALRSGTTFGLLVVDVDHFKRVNDEHGHPAGDRVLRGLAARLIMAARGSDVVARYGGEEFVVLLPGADPEVTAAVAERCRATISRSAFVLANGVRLFATVSVGAACVPEHARSLDELVRVADKALYTAKELGRDQVQLGLVDAGPGPSQLGDTGSLLIFLENLADSLDGRQSNHEHSRAVARWAALVADALGLDEEVRWRCAIAGRLHDIGKVAVPEAILGKPGPLTEDEWDVMRQHAAHGQRLVSLAPTFAFVADIIGEHHERWNGAGYPAGKAGDEICIEARVLAVCDAWATMRADRPYQRARTAEDARTELLMCQGSDFDPAVVSAFLTLEGRGRVGSLTLVRR